MAVMADSEMDRTNREALREVMRTTRNNTSVQPIPTAQATQCPTTGNVPFGMPATLNAETLQGAVVHRPQAVMEANATVGRPWELHPFTRSANVLAGCRKATWCVTCGFRKASHLKEESFGYKCQRNYCARCGWLKDCHQQSSYRMGPCCMNPHKCNSPHNEWHGNTRQVGITW